MTVFCLSLRGMAFLLIFVLLCFIAGNIYVFIRALQTVSSSPLWVKILFGVFFWAAAFMLFIVMALRHNNLPGCMLRVMFSVGTAWMVFILYMTLLLLVSDVVVRFFVPSIRNTFIYALSATLLILAAGYVNYLHPRIDRIDISLDNVAHGDSVTIVAVSDLHLGYGTGKKRLREFVDMINACKPDVVLIAGDLIDNSVIPLYEQNMAEELNMLNAPLGVYMAPGNHEYISGIEESRRFIETTKIKMLFDSVVVLPNGIQIFLRDDDSNRARLSLSDVGNMVSRDHPVILVDHKPYDIAVKDSMNIDLQISGHTHHGQVWPGNFVTDILYEQSYGYRKWQHSHVYVSSGLSLWGPPFRIGTRCDMAVFTIYGNG